MKFIIRKDKKRNNIKIKLNNIYIILLSKT